MKPRTVEELQIALTKVENDIGIGQDYLKKLEADRSKLIYTISYHQDNLAYLKKHGGVIDMEYIRDLQNQIKKVTILLKHSSADITKFENSLVVLNQEIHKIRDEIEKAKIREDNVLSFRRKDGK